MKPTILLSGIAALVSGCAAPVPIPDENKLHYALEIARKYSRTQPTTLYNETGPNQTITGMVFSYALQQEDRAKHGYSTLLFFMPIRPVQFPNGELTHFPGNYPTRIVLRTTNERLIDTSNSDISIKNNEINKPGNFSLEHLFYDTTFLVNYSIRK